MTIIITLSFAGNETGPFDLYSDADNFATAFNTSGPVSKVALLAGFQVNAPAGTTVVRLDDLSGLCLNTETDIYTCATPNCDFAGEILCNITTTTTTSTPPTTTTTTSYFPNPFGTPCLWSTNGGNSGSVAVYNFNTNTSTTVLVPNDFTETVGIERPICATEDKLWLASIVDQGSNPTNDNDDKVYVREWDIDGTTSDAPTLTYVREITVPMGQTYGHNQGGTSVWAMTAIDNNTLIVGTGNEYAPAPSEGTGGGGSIYASEFSIAASGNIIIASNDISSKWAASPASNAGKLSNLTYTNSGQLILGYRVDLTPSGGGQASAVGNSLIVFPVTPSDPEFSINNQVIPRIVLQDYGFPEFSESYNGVKGVPFWGVNGLAQVLNPETLEVYTIDQSIPNNLTFTTSVNSSNDWLSSATNCSNINFVSGDPDPDCGLTYFPNLFDGLYDSSNNNYLGPQTFTYFGMTCTASLSNDLGSWFVSNTDGGFLGCSGLLSPDSEGENILLAVQGFDFSITIDFPVPVNDIPIRASVLNSNADGTSGDVYYVETNGGTPTLSINSGCFAQVNGNRLFGGVANPPTAPDAYSNQGDGEFKVTALTNYTSMTIYGNAPTGGKLFLGCPTIALNCNLIYATSRQDCANTPGACYPGEPYYSDVFAYSPITGITEQLIFPAGTNFECQGVSISENYITITLANTEYAFTRYTYDLSSTGVPENIQWEGILYTWPSEWSTGLKVAGESISDTKLVYLYGFNRVLEVEIIGGSTVLSVTQKIIVESNAQGDCLITYKLDGVTPNKVLYHQFNGTGRRIYQYDYNAGTLDGYINTPLLSNGSYLTSGDLTMIGNYIYTSDVFTGVWYRCDTETSIWSVVLEQPNPGLAIDSGSRPQCRISDGLTKFNEATTTTTTTPPNPSGTKTIWTWFESELNS